MARSDPLTEPARTVLDVAAAHGDAGLVSQAVDEGIRRGLFTTSEIAPAAAYVASAQGSTCGGDELEALGDRFFARPFSGTCSEPPPSDWPSLAAEIGTLHGALLRVARYFPSRTMLVEFAWPVDRVPKEAEIKTLRKRLATRFSWA